MARFERTSEINEVRERESRNPSSIGTYVFPPSILKLKQPIADSFKWGRKGTKFIHKIVRSFSKWYSYRNKFCPPTHTHTHTCTHTTRHKKKKIGMILKSVSLCQWEKSSYRMSKCNGLQHLRMNEKRGIGGESLAFHPTYPNDIVNCAYGNIYVVISHRQSKHSWLWEWNTSTIDDFQCMFRNTMQDLALKSKTNKLSHYYCHIDFFAAIYVDFTHHS